MSGGRVRLAIEGGVARLTLAAPERRNAIDLQFCEDFSAAAMACATSDARVILLDAEGDMFSVGGDIDSFMAERDRIEPHVYRMSSLYHLGILALARAEAPLVIAARGMVAGGAIGLLFAADMVIASETMRLCAAFTRTGLTPDGGGTYTLVRLVGYQRAFDILATNPVLDATQARDLGLVSRLVPEADLDRERDRLVAKLAATPSGALRSLKRLMRDGLSAGFEEQLAAEARTIAKSAAHPETLARLEAFLTRSGR